ncbi:cupin domain-containing protein [Coralliovum pocilloporae]|uniref:cupin domain-containing protein n=1 Tax=Coralliovum pocilloporae TaxID=3066369 RepID=UPI003307B7F6
MMHGSAKNQFVKSVQNTAPSHEYNCKLWRLFPWLNRIETLKEINGFGAIWVQLDPDHHVEAHQHDEEEAFIVIQGNATLTIEDNIFEIHPKDVVHIPRNAMHQLSNHSKVEPFIMIDLYWDQGSQ